MNRESIEAFYKDIPSMDILGAVETILVLYESYKDPELLDIVKVMREIVVSRVTEISDLDPEEAEFSDVEFLQPFIYSEVLPDPAGPQFVKIGEYLALCVNNNGCDIYEVGNEYEVLPDSMVWVAN